MSPTTGQATGDHVQNLHSHMQSVGLHTSAGSTSLPSLSFSPSQEATGKALHGMQTSAKLHGLHALSVDNVNMASLATMKATGHSIASLASSTSPSQVFASSSQSDLPDDLLTVAADLAVSHQSLFTDSYPSPQLTIREQTTAGGSFGGQSRKPAAYSERNTSSAQNQILPLGFNSTFGDSYQAEFARRDAFAGNRAADSQRLTGGSCIPLSCNNVAATPSLTQLLHSLDSLDQYA